MEYLITAGSILGVIIFVYVIAYLNFKKAEKQFEGYLQKSYGAIFPKEFKVDEYLYIDRYFERHTEFGQLNEQTWQDLSMDLVYHEMNTSLSSCGAEYLYYLLHTPLFDEQSLKERAKKVDYWKTQEKHRIQVQMIFHRLGKLNKYSIYDYLDSVEEIEVVKASKLLLWDFLLFFSIAIMFLSMPLGLLIFFTALVHNVVTYYQIKAKINPYLTSFRYIFRMLQAAYELEMVLPETIYSEEKELVQTIKQNFRGINSGNGMLFNSDANSNPMAMLLDYINMLFSFDLMQFSKMQKIIKRNLEGIDKIVSILGSCESHIMISSYQTAKQSVGSVPILKQNETMIKAENLIHPLLENPVPNDIEIQQNILLTGSNASGKSTFLKTIALNQLFAQTIYFVLANSYVAPFFVLQTSMSLKDSVTSGDSYYMMEIKAIKKLFELTEESNKRGISFLCCIDEVLRGTNTVERIAASSEILKQLALKKVYCFAATHDIELTELLGDLFDNYHFEEALDGQDVVFSYCIKEGPATTRNAIQLLASLGFEEIIVEESRKRAKRFEEEGVWS